jgi:hypothetical protein
MGLLTVGAVTAAGIARENAADAKREPALALSRQLATQSQAIAATKPITARRLAAAAWSIARTDEVAASMAALVTKQRATLVGHTGPVSAVAFSPDSTRLASASIDGTGAAVGPVAQVNRWPTSARAGPRPGWTSSPNQHPARQAVRSATRRRRPGRRRQPPTGVPPC